jgi:hypothetical protein
MYELLCCVAAINCPNAFLVGAPKSGTTSLFHYLRQHPNIFATTPKEPNYFATDLPGSRFVKTEQAYHYLFKDAKDHHHVRCEGSVLYLYSKEAIANIKRYNPDAKLIMMFRHPVDLVYSFHSELVYGREESEADFAVAWQLIEVRKQGRMIPKTNREPKLLYYDDIAKHGEHYERVLSSFPEKQIHVIYFDDFKENTEGEYKKVLSFLGLPFHLVNLDPVNENKQHRNERIANFIQRPPSVLLKPYLRMKKLLGFEHRYFGFREPALKANTVVAQRESLPGELKERILESYQSDMQKLYSLTGRSFN